jgi:predicted nucleic acid-binding protein
MSDAEPFIDTSVLLYLLSSDTARADRAEQLLTARGVVSVQVLNEFAAVALRKARLKTKECRELLREIRRHCRIEPVTLETHDLGIDIHDRYGFAIYDSMLVAAALLVKTKTLYSEDMQHGQLLEGQLRVINPFAKH